MSEREVTKHEMARGAGGESVVSDNEEHQKREQKFSEDELGERDQIKGEKKHVDASNPRERDRERERVNKRNGIDSDHINSYNKKQQPNNPPEIDVINGLNLEV